ncbi:MAG: ribosome-associated translation inhibitor RaiA [Planctomycetes bacterium]|nr:ribosome-associated translation inhibitor RaiA [Planctomycetota bacterium]
MKITVTGRHMEVTDVTRRYALEKIKRLPRYFENIQRIEIVFNPEKDSRFSAELIAHAPRGSVLVVHANETTATAAFDTALEKMERHLSKLKDKLRKRTRADGPVKKFARTHTDDQPAGEDSGEIWW